MKLDLERGTYALRPTGPSVALPSLDPSQSGGSTVDFADRFQAALARAEGVTKAADADAEGLVQGRVDLHEAMVSMEKADITLKLGATIRNKLLDAYQQLMSASRG